MQAKYDTIGINYNTTRKADKYLTERLLKLLSPRAEGLYLDIGCGTGNYTLKLQEKGYRFTAIDPSTEMLEKARLKSLKIDWRSGYAENTGLNADSIDGIVATLTIHHWTDLHTAFLEMSRVLKKNGKMVIFTSTPEQMRGYWLNHYFPYMLRDSIAQMPSPEKIKVALDASGLQVTDTEPYFIHSDLEDLFLYSGKHNPKLYLNPEVRQGISSFAALANKTEVDKGLEKLKNDINSGEIDQVMQEYENALGDYIFIVVQHSLNNR
ncbi:putative MerR-family transcriptional regulator [Fulvivirga imtechensis AK7]|uniref:Putative MerR-family transcriptional regulator n=1 Tax=Fulvivirga imtechensis AK7 TaxID=1237149 RepID=L8JT31_9BACT|nr:class I SAM-dependent methyltransferase [Fulvivirga imtechensis]ELR70649.1 putative MerR-family transcriptional regulator [Fulvivirga imtechensis AK7]